MHRLNADMGGAEEGKTGRLMEAGGGSRRGEDGEIKSGREKRSRAAATCKNKEFAE